MRITNKKRIYMPIRSITKTAAPLATLKESAQSKKTSTISSAVNYAKAHPYKTAAGVILSVAATALLGIALNAAWNASVICSGTKTFCGKAQFSSRASAGLGAAADAAKTAGAAAQSAAQKAAETVGAAAQKAATWTADTVLGKKPLTDASCLVLGLEPGQTVIIKNNCQRPVTAYFAKLFGLNSNSTITS